MSFYREQAVKAVRKPRHCVGCEKLIEKGQPALDCAGHYDGDFWASTYHPECRAAEIALNDLHDVRHGDEWMALSEIEWEDFPWLIEAHQAVAARMNVTTERYNAIRDEQERCRRFWLEQAAKRRAPSPTNTPEQDQPHRRAK